MGRAHANKILWDVLTGPALDPAYYDLSNLITHMVYQARKMFDRPPREHWDLDYWWWTCYERNYPSMRRWAGP